MCGICYWQDLSVLYEETVISTEISNSRVTDLKSRQQMNQYCGKTWKTRKEDKETQHKGSPRNHIGKNIINSTEDEKCDIVNTLRKQILNVSFSDHDDYGEGEDVTTSDGLGSLIYLRYHLTRHHQHCQHYPQNYHQHLGNEYLQQRDNFHQSTQSNEDISQLITGVEVSSHWGTGTLTSSNESLPYSICDNVTSRGSCEPPNHQLKQHHTCTLNRTNSKNTLSDMKEKQSNDNNSINSNNQLVELIYDSILNCYYDPKSGRFYELI
ncbi:unnamed protein product [Trichobilharzia regenti]|nr:unnamed protein product [Trichobilharzia regenti]